ncbi:MAG: peptidoglycan DD-metalloendopeptidase family protein [Bryobacteraceae bacterium]|nr:peptidoglycan DD-metalloendopeptidase family protein [Bryobacterales bacterium]NUN01460.1 peptidoglycan DD-metalloendopeptidase family protein [Bryobacteraceae bacterium]
MMRLKLGSAFIGLMAAALLLLVWPERVLESESDYSVPAESAELANPPEIEYHTESVLIRSGDTLEGLLLNAGIDRLSTGEVISAVQETFDVRAFRAGAELKLTRATTGNIHSLEYSIDPDHTLKLSSGDSGFAATIEEVPGTIRNAPICGTLEESLFESIERMGERPELAIQLAEIFAWDLDFYTDPQEGDRFCILVEKKDYLNGQPSTYRRILAASYENAGQNFEAFAFEDEHGKPQFYARDGRALRAAFLKSPIKFDVRISSRFSHRRFHPVLKRYRPHLGTDYAAPAGTPVQTIASGRVVFSGYSRGAGNLVRIEHTGGYETYYLHLSRRYVRAGQRVEQGQRIGAVGATGLATGPHLDFRIRKHGKFVDFERLRFPRESKLSAARLGAFATVRDQYDSLMRSASGQAIATVARTGSPAGTP